MTTTNRHIGKEQQHANLLTDALISNVNARKLINKIKLGDKVKVEEKQSDDGKVRVKVAKGIVVYKNSKMFVFENENEYGRCCYSYNDCVRCNCKVTILKNGLFIDD